MLLVQRYKFLKGLWQALCVFQTESDKFRKSFFHQNLVEVLPRLLHSWTLLKLGVFAHTPAKASWASSFAFSSFSSLSSWRYVAYQHFPCSPPCHLVQISLRNFYHKRTCDGLRQSSDARLSSSWPSTSHIFQWPRCHTVRSGTLAEAVVLEFLVEASAAFWLREHGSL